MSTCEDPLANVARAGHVTTPPDSAPDRFALTKVTPAGRVSLTTTAAASDGPLFVVVSTYVIVSAAFTEAGAVFTICRSAWALTVVATELVSLVATGSPVVVVAAARLVIVPVVGATNVTVYVTVSASVIVPIVGQVTTPPDSVPPFDAETNVPDPGNVSVITTLAASLGPRLVTCTEYVIVSAASTAAGPVLITSRSAWSVMLVATELVSLVGTGSAVELVTAARFVIDPVTGATNVTV